MGRRCGRGAEVGAAGGEVGADFLEAGGDAAEQEMGERGAEHRRGHLLQDGEQRGQDAQA